MSVMWHFALVFAAMEILLTRSEIPTPDPTNTNSYSSSQYHQYSTPHANFRNTYVKILEGEDGQDGEEGERGLQGAQGQKGDTGPRGENGEKGSTGSEGPTGYDGEDGLQGYQGLTGDMGEKGEKGEPYAGATYTRWGHTECPDVPGTYEIYNGYTAGSLFSEYGGGANYICLPQVPAYISKHPEKETAGLFGTEYEQSYSLYYMMDKNAPCAVCYAQNRTVLVTIPAVLTCPPNWIKEYAGYLMTEKEKGPSNKVYECVDEDAQALPGSYGNHNGALFFPVVSSCTGLPCPPYKPGWQITCVVCTKAPETDSGPLQP